MGNLTKMIQASEVLQHHTIGDIWIVVDGKVYDMTRFALEHQGGGDSELISSL